MQNREGKCRLSNTTPANERDDWMTIIQERFPEISLESDTVDVSGGSWGDIPEYISLNIKLSESMCLALR
jgi:hypothetical protein